MGIQAVKDSLLWCISVHDLREMYIEYPAFQNASRLVAEQFLIDLARRMTSLITETAEERYLNFLRDRRELMEGIPLRMIASYLGTTAVHLSRIRSKLTKG